MTPTIGGWQTELESGRGWFRLAPSAAPKLIEGAMPKRYTALRYDDRREAHWCQCWDGSGPKFVDLLYGYSDTTKPDPYSMEGKVYEAEREVVHEALAINVREVAK